MTVAPATHIEARSEPAALIEIPQHRLGIGMLAVFSGPSLPIAAIGLPLSLYLPEFYANVIGVKLAAVALIFLCIRLVDLSVDPILGGMMDRTRSRFGRFRPWLALGAPLLAVSAYMTFMAQSGSGAPYLAFWLFGLYLSYSILVLSHSAWASTLASAYHERSRIYGWMQVGIVLSLILVPAIAAIAVQAHPHENGAGVHAIGWFIIALAPTTIALTCWRVREPLAPELAAKGPSLMDYVRLAIRPAVARILFADTCLAFAPAVTAALFFFFFRESRGYSTTQANLLLVTYFTGALVGGALLTHLARLIGKHRALFWGAVYYALVQVAVLLPPKGVLWAGIPFLFLQGLVYSAPTIFIRAMMADAADEAELDQGKSSTGMLYAMISSTQKIASALAIFVTFAALDAFGFVPKAHALNTQGAINGLTGLFIGLPIVFSLLGAFTLYGYRLDEARHIEVIAQLATRGARARR